MAAYERTFTLDEELFEKAFSTPQALIMLPELGRIFVKRLEEDFTVRQSRACLHGLPRSITVSSDTTPSRRVFEIADSTGFVFYVRNQEDYKDYHHSLPPRTPTTW